MNKNPDLARLVALLRRRRMLLATAESCTAGLVAKQLTDPAGSSEWFERGFVTYSNDAKVEMLGVSRETLARYGAVSRETTREMAAGALRHSRAGVALAVSGIAGPSGGAAGKPVGTVWFAWAAGGRAVEEMRRFDGGRAAVRGQAADYAIAGMLRLLELPPGDGL